MVWLRVALPELWLFTGICRSLFGHRSFAVSISLQCVIIYFFSFLFFTCVFFLFTLYREYDMPFVTHSLTLPCRWISFVIYRFIYMNICWPQIVPCLSLCRSNCVCVFATRNNIFVLVALVYVEQYTYIIESNESNKKQFFFL